MILKDKFGNRIVIANKRLQLIINKHPEIEPYINRIKYILSHPDIVKRSKRNSDTFLYYRFYKDVYQGKFLLVVARTKDNPILSTFFVTDRIKEGEIIWKKN